MSYTSNFDSNTGYDVMDELQLAFRQAHPDWSEARFQENWSRRKAELTNFYNNSPTPPRQMQSELRRSSAAPLARDSRLAPAMTGTRTWNHQAPNAGAPMSRSKTSNSYVGNISAVPSSQLQRIPSDTGYQRAGPGYSASYTYGSAQHWPSNGGTGHFQQSNELGGYLQNPTDYVSKIDCSVDYSQIAAKRQRLQSSPSLSPYTYSNTSPSTMSADLSSSPFHSSSEAMSRQLSNSSASLVDDLTMMRVGSSISACSENFPFVIEDEELSSSFLSSATQKPSNSFPVTGYDQNDMISRSSVGTVGLNDNFLYSCPPAAVMMNSQAVHQGMMSHQYSEDMLRSISQQSSSSVSSAELKSQERRQKHIEAGKRPIICKSLPTGPISGNHQKHDSKVRPLKPQQPGTKAKELIDKQPYVRPSHPKMYCKECNEYPEGFRGEHEYRRHYDRAHATRKKVWICVDPHVETKEGWRPEKPLEICKQCKQQKPYNVYYNAAAHLRRAHFFPRKRGRKAKGEVRESRAGKAGGNQPPIEWLKATGFLKEIEVSSDAYAAEDAEDSVMDDADDECNDVEYMGDNEGMINVDCVSDVEYLPNTDCVTEVDPFYLNMSAQTLGLQTYPPPMTTSFYNGYPTPELDHSMQFSGNYFACSG